MNQKTHYTCRIIGRIWQGQTCTAEITLKSNGYPHQDIGDNAYLDNVLAVMRSHAGNFASIEDYQIERVEQTMETQELDARTVRITTVKTYTILRDWEHPANDDRYSEMVEGG